MQLPGDSDIFMHPKNSTPSYVRSTINEFICYIVLSNTVHTTQLFDPIPSMYGPDHYTR